MFLISLYSLEKGLAFCVRRRSRFATTLRQEPKAVRAFQSRRPKSPTDWNSGLLVDLPNYQDVELAFRDWQFGNYEASRRPPDSVDEKQTNKEGDWTGSTIWSSWNEGEEKRNLRWSWSPRGVSQDEQAYPLINNIPSRRPPAIDPRELPHSCSASWVCPCSSTTKLLQPILWPSRSWVEIRSVKPPVPRRTPVSRKGSEAQALSCSTFRPYISPQDRPEIPA